MSTPEERKLYYATPRWKRLRVSILIRDGYSCRGECAERGLTVAANEVHHVEPIRDGGDPWHRDNLISLCRECHRATHLAERPAEPPAVAAWTALVNTLSFNL